MREGARIRGCVDGQRPGGRVCRDWRGGGRRGVDNGPREFEGLLRRVRRAGRRSFEPGTKPREVVEKLELVRGGHPTWASILLFGKRPQSPLIQATVHCGRFRTETDIVDDRLIEGSIVDQIDETMDFLKKHTTQFMTPAEAAQVFRASSR